MSEFQSLDLGGFLSSDQAEKARIGRQIDRICRETGFLAVTNHGVPPQVINDVWSAALGFFARPNDEKQRVSPPRAGYPYGYLGAGTEALAKSRGEDTPPDLKESFNGGPQQIPAGMNDPEALAFCYEPTIWPDAPEGFKAAWKHYYSHMEQLAGQIMGAFAVALELDESHFEPFITEPISALRALNYPAQTDPPKAGQLRAGAHTDYGSLTILLPEPGSKGLEILTPNGDWLPIAPIDGAFVVNIGDLMQRWTNDRWASTLHRVVTPSDWAGKPRQSLAFFHQPNWHAEITCLPGCVKPGEASKYSSVRSGPYLMEKFKAANG